MIMVMHSSPLLGCVCVLNTCVVMGGRGGVACSVCGALDQTPRCTRTHDTRTLKHLTYLGGKPPKPPCGGGLRPPHPPMNAHQTYAHTQTLNILGGQAPQTPLWWGASPPTPPKASAHSST